jgi:hypothetical protein
MFIVLDGGVGEGLEVWWEGGEEFGGDVLLRRYH